MNIEAKTNYKIDKKQTIYAILTGVGAGIANGLFGGGGGMIVVPMLWMLLKYPVKKAHATAILIILPLSIVSGLFYTVFGINVNVILSVTIGTVVGGILGSFLLAKLSNKWVSILFSAVMVFAGVKMLIF